MFGLTPSSWPGPCRVGFQERRRKTTEAPRPLMCAAKLPWSLRLFGLAPGRWQSKPGRLLGHDRFGFGPPCWGGSMLLAAGRVKR